MRCSAAPCRRRSRSRLVLGLRGDGVAKQAVLKRGCGRDACGLETWDAGEQPAPQDVLLEEHQRLGAGARRSSVELRLGFVSKLATALAEQHAVLPHRGHLRRDGSLTAE